MKKTRRIRISYEQDVREIDQPIKEFIETWKSRLGEIPEELRNTATVEITTCDHGYGVTLIDIDVVYERPETDEEEVVRERREKTLDERNKASKVIKYHALKAELGL